MALPPDPASWQERLRQVYDQQRAVGEQFAHGARTSEVAWTLVDRLHAAADAAVEHWPQRTAHACAPGCSFCCYLWTDALPLEILRIADYLQRTASPEDLAELCRRLGERLAAPLGQRPCGLLTADGRCAVYALRPMTCRGFHSFSKPSCQVVFEGQAAGHPTGLDEWLHMLVAEMQAGFEHGLGKHGFESGWVELNEALLHALERPVSLRAWLHQEPIFPWLSQ